MKRIFLRIKSGYVLEHRSDAVLPVALFVKACERKFKNCLKIIKESFDNCILAVTDPSLNENEILKIVSEIIENDLKISKDSGIAQFVVDDVKETLDDADDVSLETEREAEIERIHAERERIAREQKENLDAMLADLVGAEEFKALINEIDLVAPRIIENQSLSSFRFQNFLIAINDGCGLSTYLQLLAESVAINGLMVTSEARKILEVKLNAPNQNQPTPYVSSSVLITKNRIICIDISEWMTKLKTKEFKDFLLKIEINSANSIYVFRVPFVELDVLEDINEALNDILFTRIILIPPMSSSEMTECAKRTLAKQGFTASDEAWEYFDRRMSEEKSDGRFYGMNTIEKVVLEMVYLKQLNDVRNEKNDKIIEKSDILPLVRKPDFDSDEGLGTLDDMVGMGKIRETVEEIISRIELSKANAQFATPCIHMRFLGNPGTGKTTVARIIGKILKDKGILRTGGFFEYSGRDFCGRYIGETAPKTSAMCRDAYGSVLFIDEAYSLYRGAEDIKDFGREALDTLIAEMENHRSDLVVIMAGYPEEMTELMNGNAGLESRMPYLIEFPNYTRDELYEIFMRMLKDGIKHDEDFDSEVKFYFDSISDSVLQSKSFSNARFVRNLFERTCAKAAMRKKFDSKEDFVLLKEDFKSASSERMFSSLLEKKPKTKNRIGFNN